jgi:hypothetical protein
MTSFRPGQYQPYAALEGSASPEIPLIWHGQDDRLAAPRWLVDETVPERGKGLLSGQWGTGKTFVALDLAAAVMTGGSFARRQVLRRGGVLFIAAEGAYEIPIRLRGLTGSKLRERADPVLDRGHLPFAWAEACPPLASGDAIPILLSTALSAADRMETIHDLPLALIIIDTLAASAGFTDENNAAEGQRIMNRLGELSHGTGAFVLAVDHFGKMTETGTRGSSAKEAAADVVLALLGDRETRGATSNTRLALRKLRGGPAGSETPYHLQTVPIEVSGAEATTCVVEWASHDALGAPKQERWPASLRVFRAALRTALVEASEERRPFGAEGPVVRVVAESAVRREFVASYPAEGETSEKRSEAKRKAFSRALKAALDKGLVLSRELVGVDHLWPADGQDVHAPDRQDTL